MSSDRAVDSDEEGCRGVPLCDELGRMPSNESTWDASRSAQPGSALVGPALYWVLLAVRSVPMTARPQRWSPAAARWWPAGLTLLALARMTAR